MVMRPRSGRSTENAPRIKACVCEGSNGPAAPFVEHYIGSIDDTSYSCIDRQMITAKPTLCVFGDMGNFSMYQIDALNMTKAGESAVLLKVDDFHVQYGSDGNFAVMHVKMMDESGFNIHRDDRVNVSGQVLLRHMQQRQEEEGGSLVTSLFLEILKPSVKSFQLKKEFHIVTSINNMRSPLPAHTMCSCSSTKWKEGQSLQVKSLGIIEHSSVSYSCDEGGNRVSLGSMNEICLSILPGQDYRLYRVELMKLTHSLTGSLIRTSSVDASLEG
jgi:hypothetical protein